MKYSLKEINETEKWKDVSPFLYIYRKISVIFVWIICKTQLTPNQTTNISTLFGILAAIGFASGDKEHIFLGGVLSQLYMILDCADGLLSRMKNNSSKFGAVFDVVSDVFVNNAVLLGIGIGLYTQTQRLEILLIPFMALFGMNMTVVTHNTQMMVFRDEPLRSSSMINEFRKRSNILKEIIIKLQLSGSFQFFIIGIGALMNQLLWSVVIIAVLQNIYWIGIVILMYSSYRKEISYRKHEI